MNNLNTPVPITLGCGDTINNLTFDGCHYFGTLKGKCEIIKLNNCFEKVKIFKTCREYNAISYDPCSK